MATQPHVIATRAPRARSARREAPIQAAGLDVVAPHRANACVQIRPNAPGSWAAWARAAKKQLELADSSSGSALDLAAPTERPPSVRALQHGRAVSSELFGVSLRLTRRVGGDLDSPLGVLGLVARRLDQLDLRALHIRVGPDRGGGRAAPAECLPGVRALQRGRAVVCELVAVSVQT